MVTAWILNYITEVHTIATYCILHRRQRLTEMIR